MPACALALLVAIVLGACSRQRQEAPYAPTLEQPPVSATLVEYKLGIVPMENFRNIYAVYLPIVEYLNARLPGIQLTLEVPRGLAEFEQGIHSGKYSIALANPYHTYHAVKRGSYQVFGKMDDDDAFRGILITRRGSPICELHDLKGQKIAFPPTTALAATLMVQAYLKENGIDPVQDIEAKFVSGQHAAIMEVYAGNVAVGATWPLAWISFQRLHPREAQQLEVRFASNSLINQGLMAHRDMPPALVHRIAELLVGLDQSEEGRTMLARVPLTRFERATDASYNVVGHFLDRHRRLLAPAVPGA